MARTTSSTHFVFRDQAAGEPLRVLIFGPHPDDADFKAAGVTALYTRLGHQVKIVSVTNGNAGHHAMGGAPLAQRRRQEAAAAGKVLGAEYITLDNDDCVLMPTLEIRHQLVRIIREVKPDLVMTPRPNDYHPDHRNTSILVQDAVCMGSVPNLISGVPYLDYTPTVVYLWDDFQKPYRFIPDVVVAIDEVIEQKVDALACHECQMFEFLPYIRRYIDQVPKGPAERRAWLRQWLETLLVQVADLYRDKLIERYGEKKGRQVRYAEAFEACEYGARLTPDLAKRLFPF